MNKLERLREILLEAYQSEVIVHEDIGIAIQLLDEFLIYEPKPNLDSCVVEVDEETWGRVTKELDDPDREIPEGLKKLFNKE